MSATGTGRDAGARIAAAAALVAIAGTALAVRSLSFEYVFVGGDVVFPPADVQYHLRRAFYTFVNFPGVLLWDSYLNYPDGAPVPWPPLFDWTVGAAARALASDAHGFEVVAAWTAPVLGAATTWPVYLAARRLDGRAASLGAAAVLALLPVHLFYSQVGNADHHCAAAFVGAWLLWACLGLLEPDADRRALRAPGIGLALGRAAILLTWPGSLLYLALVDGVLLVAGVATGRRPLFAAQALSAVASAALVLPVLWASPTPLGGDYSAVALSRLHLLATAGVALLAGGAWLLEERGALGTPARRVAWLAGTGGLFALVLLAVPGVRSGLVLAFEFLTMSDGAGASTAEQEPLFAFLGRASPVPAEWLFGYFVYVLPVAPLALLGLESARRRRPVVLGLVGVALCLGLLTVSQRRYGNDLAPAASVVLALLLAEGGRRLARVTGAPALLGAGIAVAGALAVLSPGLQGVVAPRARASLAALGGARPPSVGLPNESLMRLGRLVRDTTPETSHYLAPDAPPEYGVLANANLGHTLKYYGRRPSSADPFWAKLGPANFQAVTAFQTSQSEEEAWRIAEGLGARFVVTSPAAPGTVMDRLHRLDGRRADGAPALARFRLVGEVAPRPGEREIPFKLFERVAGAILTVQGEPGARVTAALAVPTSTGRRFSWRAVTRLDAEGAARIRVPYAPGPYAVTVGARERSVVVGEADVLEGRAVAVEP